EQAGQAANRHVLVGVLRDGTDDDEVDAEDERQQRPGHDDVGETVDQVVPGHVDQDLHAQFLSLTSSVARPTAWTITCCNDRGSRLRCSSRARALSPASSVSPITTVSWAAIRRRSQVVRPPTNASTAAIGPLTVVAAPRTSSASASSTTRPWSSITTRSSKSA